MGSWKSTETQEILKIIFFFLKFPNATRFQLFFDETEVTEPLGSKTKQHELGMFCYRIEN